MKEIGQYYFNNKTKDFNSMNRTKLAIFDLDYTILDTDSTYHFFIEIMKIKPISIFNIPISIFWGLVHVFKGIDRTRFKEIFFTPLKYLNENEFKSLKSNLIKKCIRHIKTQAVKEIETKKEQGYSLVMISASPEFYIEGIANSLGFDYIIGTQMKFNRKKVWIEGKNCKDYEKIKRLKKMIDLSKIDLENSVSYSDSKTDLPLLRLTGKGYMVDKKKWTLKEVD